VAKIEGKDNTSKDKLGDAFEALLADTSEEEDDLKQYSNSYFTLVESLSIKVPVVPSIVIPYAKTLVKDLNN
jgi:hypothetical protein